MTATRLACLFLVLATGRTVAADVLVATVVRGEVERAAGAVHVLDELQPGDGLQLNAGATAVVWWRRSNQRIVMAGPGRFRLDTGGVVPLTPSGGAHTLRSAGRADGAQNRPPETMAGAILRTASDAYATGSGALDPVAPSQAYVEWPARPHVGAWTLHLRDTGGAVLHDATTVDNHYALPPGVQLQPGQRYTLEVIWTSAMRGEQMEIYPFDTLDQATDRRIAEMHKAADASLEGRLAYAQELVQYGLVTLAHRISLEALEPYQ